MAERIAHDRGFAVVVALLVTMISFILATAVLAQAVHNVSQAGYMRKRTTAIHAAEAGLNWYANWMQGADVADLWSKPWTSTSPTGWLHMSSADVASANVAMYPDQAVFELRVFYSKTDVCATAPCSAKDLTALSAPTPGSPLPEVIYAIVRSVGTAGGVSRALESAVRLRPTAGGAASEVGLLGTILCFDSGGKLWLTGSLQIRDAAPSSYPTYLPTDCKQQGLRVTSGNLLDVTGNIEIDKQGLVATTGISGGFRVGGDVTAGGSVQLGTAGDASADCSASGTICVEGSASGDPVTVGKGAAVLGGTANCEGPCQTSLEPFLQDVIDEATWKSLGWRVEEVTSGADVLSKLATTTVKTVFYIPGATGSPGCDVVFDGKYRVNTEIAIYSNCKFELDATDEISGPVGASITLASAWPSTLGVPDAAPSCAGSRDITISTGATAIGVPMRFYTPCVLTIANNWATPVTADFEARFIVLKNSIKLTSNGSSTSGPGSSGFLQDVRYVKEIRVSMAFLV